MRLTMPMAVLLGIAFAGLCVAGAVYFGLRARGGEGAAGAAAGAQGDAARALAAQHDALVKACWPDAPPPPGSRAFTVHLEFDAEGRQAAKALITPRTIGRPEEIACVARALGPIEIARANGPAVVDARLALP